MNESAADERLRLSEEEVDATLSADWWRVAGDSKRERELTHSGSGEPRG